MAGFKSLFSALLFACAALLGACVSVDKSVAPNPSEFWNAPEGAVPDTVIEPEQILTDKIVDAQKDSASGSVKEAGVSGGEDSAKTSANSANVSVSGKAAKHQNGSKVQNDAIEAKAAGLPKSSPLSAAEKLLIGRELDLSEIVDIALENNTQTRVYWFQAKSYAASYGKANASYYPQVSVGMDVYRSKTLPSIAYWNTPAIGSYYETGYGPSAQINWLLYDFGKREAQVESAKEALRAANFDYNQTIQDVVLAVNIAYFNFYAATAALETAKLNLEDANTAYDSAKARYDQGIGNKQDMLNALANAKNAEFALEKASAGVESARAELASSMGVRVSSSLKISTAVRIPKSPDTAKKIEELIASALRSRQNLLAAYAQLRKAASDTRAAERDFLPQIGAQGTASYQWYTDGQRGDQYSYQAGLSVSWSLFEGFTRKYDLINAKVAERAQAQKLKAAEIEIISDVWTYYHNYLSAVKQVASTDAAVTANLEAYQATKIGYENGVNSITDLLNAQTRLASARQNKISAESDLSMSIAQLSHATGALLAGTRGENPPPSIKAKAKPGKTQ